MTSSLVGSEMCIRDRCEYEYIDSQQYTTRTYVLDEDDIHTILEHGDMTVSYTHLTLPTICSV
eukprot:7726976-Prorocentrum_lima.AAC.1